MTGDGRAFPGMWWAAWNEVLAAWHAFAAMAHLLMHDRHRKAQAARAARARTFRGR